MQHLKHTYALYSYCRSLAYSNNRSISSRESTCTFLALAGLSNAAPFAPPAPGECLASYANNAVLTPSSSAAGACPPVFSPSGVP